MSKIRHHSRLTSPPTCSNCRVPLESQETDEMPSSAVRKKEARPLLWLTIAYFSIVLTVVGIVLFMFNQTQRLGVEHEREAQMRELAVTIFWYDEVLTTAARMAALRGETSWRERYDRFVPRLEDALAQARALSPAAADATAETTAANRALVRMEEQAFALVESGRLEEAKELLFGADYQEQKRLYTAGMRTFVDTLQSEASGGREQRLNQAHSLLIVVMISILALLGVGGVSFWTARGHLMGQKRRIASLLDVVSLAATGDLTGKPEDEVTREGDALAHLGLGLKTMSENLGGLVRQARGLGGELAETSLALEARASQEGQVVSEQASAVSEIADTAHKISMTSTELAQTMSEVNMTAQETAHSADRATTELSNAKTAVGQTAEVALSVSSQLRELGRKADQLSGITELIATISRRTNLLSLNAAIEAEGAGESGKGFSVVATEIRRLAEQSSYASSKITRVLGDIQAGVRDGELKMSNLAADAQSAFGQVATASDQLAEIAGQVHEMTEKFRDVDSGMESQATGARQITRKIDRLNRSIHEATETLAQSHSAIAQLSSRAGEMKEEMSRFVLS